MCYNFFMKYRYAILPLLILPVFLFFGIEKEDRREPAVRAASSLEEVRIVNRKDNSGAWTITARKADFSLDETVAYLHDLNIAASGEGIRLSAGRGTYNTATRELSLSDRIEIRSRDSVISASELSWKPSDGTLSSGDRVRMDGRSFRIEGEGLTATEDQKLRLRKNVTATFF